MSQSRNYFEHPPESFFTQFSRINPVLSTLGFLKWAGDLERNKKPQSASVKEKAVYKDEIYRDENDFIIAQIKHYEDVPMLETYTDDPILGARARAKLVGKYYLDFYYRYLQYLPIAARMVDGRYHPNLQFLPTWLQRFIGPLYMNPLQYLDEEIDRRQFDFSSIYDDLHENMKEVNRLVAEHNQTVPFYLQYSFFTLKSFLHFVVFCDVFKGLGEKGLCACSGFFLPDKTTYRHVDWLAIEELAHYLLNSLSPIRKFSEETAISLDPPNAILSFGLPPGYFGITSCNDKEAVFILNEATRQYSVRHGKPNSVPQLLFSTQVAEHASSPEEVKSYLEKKQPASSHILAVVSKKGAGYFSMRPNDTEQVYRFTGYLDGEEPRLIVFANHFPKENNEEEPVNDSEGIGCSNLRRGLLKEAAKAWLQNKKDPSLEEKARVASSWFASTVTYRFEFNPHRVQMNASNNNSGNAVDLNQGNQYHPTELNLQKVFSQFNETCASLKLKMKNTKIKREITIKEKTDAALKKLMILANTLVGVQSLLANQLKDLYSELMNEFVKHYPQPLPGRLLKNDQAIFDIAYATVKVVKILFQNTEVVIQGEELRRLKEYTNTIEKIPSDLQLKIKPGVTSIVAMMASMLLFAKFFSLIDPTTANILLLFIGIGLYQSESIYQRPHLSIFGRNVENELKKIQSQSKEERCLSGITF